MAKQCNCENSDCNHPAAGCPNPPGKRRMMYVGSCCDECAANMPQEYMLPEGAGMIGPRKPMKHHIKPKNFLEQVDVDVDQIPAEDVHPDAAEFSPEMGVAEREGSNDDRDSDIEYQWNMRNLDRRNAMINKKQLLKMAETLENPENLEMVDDASLEVVAESLVRAANYLRMAADEVAIMEPSPEELTVEKLEQLAAIAESFSESGDDLLQKQAATIDDLLVILGSPKNALMFSLAKDEDTRIEELKKKYKDTLETQHKNNGVKEAIEAIEASPVYKTYNEKNSGRPLQYSLNTRTCINHPGAQLQRVGDNSARCSLGGEILDFNEGFTTLKGTKIPGTNVSNQNAADEHNSFTSFDSDSRSARMGYSAGGN